MCGYLIGNRIGEVLTRNALRFVQRCDTEKDLHNTVVGFDPRRQVLLLKRKAKEAMEKKVAAENERLRKLNEVRNVVIVVRSCDVTCCRK
jgi:hypothetical protein